MDRSGRPVAVSGYFANSDDVKQAETLSFAGDAAMSALATAFRQLGVTVTSALLQQSETRGDYQLFALNTLLKEFGLSRPAPLQTVWYESPDKQVPASSPQYFG